MPDISKCSGKDCPLKESCYRFTAVSSDYQSYFMTPPIKDGKCEHYWEDKTLKQKGKWKKL
jgi:hypothetical protein